MGMINDPISDMLTRIRNASAVKKPEVVIPYSKLKHRIADILHREGYLGKVSKDEPDTEKSGFATLRVGLKYSDAKEPAFRTLKRISKPGLRVYKDKGNMPVVSNNLGVAIISTSRGLMTNVEAKREGVGGEVICEIF